RVLHLMFAGEWAVDVQIAETEAARAGVDFDIGWSHCRYDRYTEFGGMCLDHRSRFFALRRDYHRHSALEDARLLPGYRFRAGAEVLLVIVVDWRDHAQCGCDHVGRSETPAESDFEHHAIGALFGEHKERHRGDGFEIRGVHIERAFDRGMHLLECSGESGGGDRLTIDLDALGGLGEVRRGEESASTGVDLRSRAHVYPAVSASPAPIGQTESTRGGTASTSPTSNAPTAPRLPTESTTVSAPIERIACAASR